MQAHLIPHPTGNWEVTSTKIQGHPPPIFAYQFFVASEVRMIFPLYAGPDGISVHRYIHMYIHRTAH